MTAALNLSDFVGLPYEAPNGCWRLVCRVYRALFGIALPAFDAGSFEHQALHAVVDSQRGTWARVEAERAGDLVLFKVMGGLYHIGVVQTPGRFLHVFAEGETSRVEHYDSPAWRRRIEGFYRHASV